MSNNGNGGEFFKGLIFGGIVGAVAALLYAPKTGREMRDEIRHRSLDLRDDVDAKLELAQRRAEKLMQQTEAELADLRKDAEAALKELRDSAEAKVSGGKAAIDKGKDRIKEAIDAGVSAFKEEKAAKGKKA